MPKKRNCGPRWTAVTYRAVAAAVAKEPDSDAKDAITLRLARMFKIDNPKFQPSKFDAACAYKCEDD